MNELSKNQEKGKRLTKKQAGVLLVVSILIIFGGKFLNENNYLVLTLKAIAELIALYALISLLTKRGLRWK